MAADPQLQIGMGLVEQVLLLMRKQYGLDIMREEMTFRPALGTVMRELLGDVPPQPDSNLRPFSVRGNEFWFNGQPFKFTGFNLREAAWYGTPQAEHADWNFLMGDQLRWVRELGGKVVRFYAAHQEYTIEQAIPRVNAVLNLLQNHGLYAIVALTDGVHSGFSIRDTTQNFRGRHTHEFYAGGYEQNYLPYITRMLEAIGSHPAIFMIEPGNEFLVPFPPFAAEPTPAQYDNVLNFFRVASDTIRAGAPEKLIGTGLVSAREAFAGHAYGGRELGKQLYALPNINAASVHTYEGSRTHRWGDTGPNLEAEMAMQGHPIYLGEVGMKVGTGDGGWVGRLGAETDHRVSGMVQWALQASPSDRGVGDLEAGMNMFQSAMWHHYVGAWKYLSREVFP